MRMTRGTNRFECFFRVASKDKLEETRYCQPAMFLAGSGPHWCDEKCTYSECRSRFLQLQIRAQACRSREAEIRQPRGALSVLRIVRLRFSIVKSPVYLILDALETDGPIFIFVQSLRRG